MADAAQAYALRRDAGKTFEWLGRAWAFRAPPRCKDDPRFAAFAKKVGLSTTTEAKAVPGAMFDTSPQLDCNGRV